MPAVVACDQAGRAERRSDMVVAAGMLSPWHLHKASTTYRLLRRGASVQTSDDAHIADAREIVQLRVVVITERNGCSGESVGDSA